MEDYSSGPVTATVGGPPSTPGRAQGALLVHHGEPWVYLDGAWFKYWTGSARPSPSHHWDLTSWTWATSTPGAPAPPTDGQLSLAPGSNSVIIRPIDPPTPSRFGRAPAEPGHQGAMSDLDGVPWIWVDGAWCVNWSRTNQPLLGNEIRLLEVSGTPQVAPGPPAQPLAAPLVPQMAGPPNGAETAASAIELDSVSADRPLESPREDLNSRIEIPEPVGSSGRSLKGLWSALILFCLAALGFLIWTLFIRSDDAPSDTLPDSDLTSELATDGGDLSTDNPAQTPTAGSQSPGAALPGTDQNGAIDQAPLGSGPNDAALLTSMVTLEACTSWIPLDQAAASAIFEYPPPPAPVTTQEMVAQWLCTPVGPLEQLPTNAPIAAGASFSGDLAALGTHQLIAWNVLGPRRPGADYEWSVFHTDGVDILPPSDILFDTFQRLDFVNPPTRIWTVDVNSQTFTARDTPSFTEFPSAGFSVIGDQYGIVAIPLDEIPDTGHLWLQLFARETPPDQEPNALDPTWHVVLGGPAIPVTP